jgi:hypothetical protein
MRMKLLAATCLALLLAVPAIAQADILVATDATPQIGGSNLNILYFDSATGALLPVPQGVNRTTADSFHPSLSQDGRYITYEIRGLSPGAVGAVRMADLTTGQDVGIIDGFDAARLRPNDPSFNQIPGSHTIVVGSDNTLACEAPLFINVASFPTPPFPVTPYSRPVQLTTMIRNPPFCVRQPSLATTFDRFVFHPDLAYEDPENLVIFRLAANQEKGSRRQANT